MAKNSELFIVAVGTSAGGIEALEGLFRAMRSDTGLAFVLIAHLAPHKASMLDEIVGRFTAMPVVQAQDGAVVEADHVYVIPPDGVAHHRARPAAGASAGEGAATPGSPIDLFFNSLADDRGDHAIGIVLSGAAATARWGSRRSRNAAG